VTEGHVPLQRAQLLLVEDLVDQALVAHGHDVAVLRGRDAGRFLPAVLERVEREIGEPRDLATRCDYAEDPALIARAIAVFEKGFSREQGTGERWLPWVQPARSRLASANDAFVA
jgi:hypothetical protein